MSWCIIVIVLAGGKRDFCLHDANELWRQATASRRHRTVSPADGNSYRNQNRKHDEMNLSRGVSKFTQDGKIYQSRLVYTGKR